MPIDFRASQIQTSKIIVTGSTGTNADILIYGKASEGAPPNQGVIDSTKFPTGSIGTDVFLYVSGSSNDKSVFGGDLKTSGSFNVLGNSVFFSGSNILWNNTVITSFTLPTSASEINLIAKTTTTSVSPKGSILTVTIPTDSGLIIDTSIKLIGKSTNLNNRASFEAKLFAYSSGSNSYVQEDSMTVIPQEFKTDEDMDYNIGISGNTLSFYVTGSSSYSINWTLFTKLFIM